MTTIIFTAICVFALYRFYCFLQEEWLIKQQEKEKRTGIFYTNNSQQISEHKTSK